jgi:hypothetical protein
VRLRERVVLFVRELKEQRDSSLGDMRGRHASLRNLREMKLGGVRELRAGQVPAALNFFYPKPTLPRTARVGRNPTHFDKITTKSKCIEAGLAGFYPHLGKTLFVRNRFSLFFFFFFK